MNWPDVVNGMLESMGALFILVSILKLHKDKLVRGVSWIHVGFFAAWGYWNLFYYPHLDQWMSFSGSILIVVANTIWLIQLLYHLWREQRR